jgi:hypothetical protein
MKLNLTMLDVMSSSVVPGGTAVLWTKNFWACIVTEMTRKLRKKPSITESDRIRQAETQYFHLFVQTWFKILIDQKILLVMLVHLRLYQAAFLWSRITAFIISIIKLHLDRCFIWNIKYTIGHMHHHFLFFFQNLSQTHVWDIFFWI